MSGLSTSRRNAGSSLSLHKSSTSGSMTYITTIPSESWAREGVAQSHLRGSPSITTRLCQWRTTTSALNPTNLSSGRVTNSDWDSSHPTRILVHGMDVSIRVLSGQSTSNKNYLTSLLSSLRLHRCAMEIEE
jgi:hypothetical protein